MFKNDVTKQFFPVNDWSGEKADLVLSLDVIFHLIEDSVFEGYMKKLFDASSKYIIIYSSNKTKKTVASHVRHRKFTPWVEQNRPKWKLLKFIPNRYLYAGNNDAGSFSDFYIYKKGSC
jgi:hypothetical protein